MAKHAHPHRRGAKWLPADPSVQQTWLAALIEEELDPERPLHPALRDLQDLIESDARLFMLFNEMFEQIPVNPADDRDPSGEPQVRDYRTMLRLLNVVMTRAPEFNRTGVVGTPINAILDRTMSTPARFAAYLDPRVNAQLKIVLDEWGTFLRSADSCSVLTDDPHRGWFGKDAMQAMPHFVDEFICEPGKPRFGFRSWDEFFTRRLKPGARPAAEPDDNKVIVNACESAPYRIATQVRRRDRFWIKGQPYSVEHMLAGHPSVERFIGGSVYQAFLSALSYHRWHAPISGKVVETRLIPGTYYSETLTESDDPSAPTGSQSYITAVATRAMILIEADDPAVGLVCFLAVGMVEVSTSEITVYPGQRLAKGDEMGMFHYGGSTYCLLFTPEVRLEFDLHGQEAGVDAANIPVRSRIATVR